VQLADSNWWQQVISRFGKVSLSDIVSQLVW